MNGYESLDFFGKAISLLAHLFVLAICFRAYTSRKISPLLVIGLAAVLAIVAVLIDLLFLRTASTPASYKSYWLAASILWILDAILYSIGIFLLVTRYFGPSKKESPSSS